MLRSSQRSRSRQGNHDVVFLSHRFSINAEQIRSIGDGFVSTLKRKERYLLRFLACWQCCSLRCPWRDCDAQLVCSAPLADCHRCTTHGRNCKLARHFSEMWNAPRSSQTMLFFRTAFPPHGIRGAGDVSMSVCRVDCAKRLAFTGRFGGANVRSGLKRPIVLRLAGPPCGTDRLWSIRLDCDHR